MYTVNYKNFSTQFKAVKSNWNFVLNEIFRVCTCLKRTNTQFHLKKKSVRFTARRYFLRLAVSNLSIRSTTNYNAERERGHYAIYSKN